VGRLSRAGLRVPDGRSCRSSTSCCAPTRWRLLFVSLSALLWLLTTIYAIAYLEGSPNRSRFFGFFSLCVSATVGIALAGNLFTFVVFYELLTLSTYPLVVHRGTAASLRAGRVYLRYTLAGGAVLLLAASGSTAWSARVEFEGGASLAAAVAVARRARAIFALLVGGLGVKAALVPLHGWLPVAMVAPAPVSALLHAVAVVKAGAFGIVRVVYDVYGIRFSRGARRDRPLAVAGRVTIVYGSVRRCSGRPEARLAFSTVSQVSYIALGVAIAGPSATIGGVVHLVHQGLMKITLFFCAGNLAETLGMHRVSEMRGVGRRMPWTMAAFTVAAFGMIGVPPLAGFVSKWYLGSARSRPAQPWVVGGAGREHAAQRRLLPADRAPRLVRRGIGAPMLLLMPIVAPLVLALLVAWPRTRIVAMAVAPWAALPGLGVAAFGPADAAATADWLLLGARLALDDLARVVLLFTATLWVAAGAFARRYLAGDPRRARFVAWFLVTLAGNLGARPCGRHAHLLCLLRGHELRGLSAGRPRGRPRRRCRPRAPTSCS
jgi:multicomponent K+:H+ antiporter subunit A